MLMAREKLTGAIFAFWVFVFSESCIVVVVIAVVFDVAVAVVVNCYSCCSGFFLLIMSD